MASFLLSCVFEMKNNVIVDSIVGASLYSYINPKLWIAFMVGIAVGVLLMYMLGNGRRNTETECHREARGWE